MHGAYRGGREVLADSHQSVFSLRVSASCDLVKASEREEFEGLGELS